jgi:hypothetical protein
MATYARARRLALRLAIRETTLRLTPAELARVLPRIRRGSYGPAFASGLQLVSGADLRGKANKYGHSYEVVRASVLRVIRAAGIPLVDVIGQHGARSIWSVDALAAEFGVPQRPADAPSIAA